MKKINKNDPLIKYGGYASLMTAIVVVVVIILNMAVSQFDIKFDLTKNKLYTLSQDTVSLIKDLEQDVNIYSLYAEGSEITVVTEILDKYASYSDHINVSNVDPYTDPSFTVKYTQNGQAPTVGSIVVETDSGFSVIPYDEVADISVDQMSQTAYIRGIKLESVLTGTIRQLTNGAEEFVYQLTGHGETALGEDLEKELGYSGFELKTLDLITSGTMPEDCGILVINGPESDISQRELDEIGKYLQGGGKAFISFTLTTSEMPNFDSLLADYGIANSGRIVMEGDTNHALNNNALYLVPDLNAENEISSSLVDAGTTIFMPVSVSIDSLQAKRSTVNIEEAAATSQYAYSKDIMEITAENNGAKADGDPEGPFTIAAAITDTDINGVEEGTKIVVSGTPMLLDDSTNNLVNGGNYGFVMNAFDWLNGVESIDRTKSIGAEEYLQITQSKAIVIMFVSVIVIPLAILLVGVAVFIKRRNK